MQGGQREKKRLKINVTYEAYSQAENGETINAFFGQKQADESGYLTVIHDDYIFISEYINSFTSLKRSRHLFSTSAYIKTTIFLVCSSPIDSSKARISVLGTAPPPVADAGALPRGRNTEQCDALQASSATMFLTDYTFSFKARFHNTEAKKSLKTKHYNFHNKCRHLPSDKCPHINNYFLFGMFFLKIIKQ